MTSLSVQTGEAGEGDAHSVTAEQAKSLLAKANAHGDIQTTFSQLPPIGKPPQWWADFLEAMKVFFEAVGAFLEPLGPFLPWVIYGVAALLLVLILVPIVRLLLHTPIGKLFIGRNLGRETAWKPTREAAAALLEDIDALATRGEYDQAVHLLLLRSVADINAFRPDLVRVHYSARDISRHPLLPESGRAAFSRIVGWVERSYFGGVPVGKAGFEDCRAAYVEFIQAEGLV